MQVVSSSSGSTDLVANSSDMSRSQRRNIVNELETGYTRGSQKTMVDGKRCGGKRLSAAQIQQRHARLTKYYHSKGKDATYEALQKGFIPEVLAQLAQGIRNAIQHEGEGTRKAIQHGVQGLHDRHNATEGLILTHGAMLKGQGAVLNQILAELQTKKVNDKEETVAQKAETARAKAEKAEKATEKAAETTRVKAETARVKAERATEAAKVAKDAKDAKEEKQKAATIVKENKMKNILMEFMWRERWGGCEDPKSWSPQVRAM